jgi:hypothetical protein
MRTLNEAGEHARDRGYVLEFNIQRRHPHRTPEVLLADVLPTQIPYPSGRIIRVTKYGEDA